MAGDDNANRNQTPPNSNNNDTNSSSRSSRQWPGDDNPFVAFRRFADEQISSMLQSIMELPPMITPPLPDRWSIFMDDHYYNTKKRQAEEIDRDDLPLDAYRYYPRWGIDHGGFPGSFWRYDFDDFFPFSSRSVLPFMAPFDDGWMDDRVSWPGAFLVLSPYSPMNLERRSLRQQRDTTGVFSSLMSSLSLASDNNKEQQESSVPDGVETRWYEAFEDLIRLENGKPMLDREANDVSKRETGMDWLRGMVQRGSFGDGWKWQQGDGHNPDGFFMLRRGQDLPPHAVEGAASDESQEADKADAPGAMTEQDMYDRFLDDLERREREFSGFVDESRVLRFLLGEPQRRFPRDVVDNRDYNGTDSWMGSKSELVSNETTTTTTDSKTSVQPSTVNISSEENPQADQQPRVISTNTNTQRVRMADGSIHTKTVKTQRFADGREESNESVDVVSAPEQRVQDVSASGTGTGQDKADPNEQGSGSKGGWFWSR